MTVQWCIISEALTFENHSYGSLVRGDYGDKKTYHHNLYAHNNGRNPRPGNYTATATDSEGLYFDFRNNVVYNWKGNEPGYNADYTTTSRYNFIGNAYITGTESSITDRIFRESCIDAYGYFENNSYNGMVPVEPWSQVNFSGFTAEQIETYKSRSYPIPMESVITSSPDQARLDVLAAAGASYPVRDTIDRRIVNEVVMGTGHSIASIAEQPEGAWPVLNSLPAPPDDDHDGMPNDWELARALNPDDPEDRNETGLDGYTQLDVYLSSLTGEIETAFEKQATSRLQQFILLQNYPNPFNSSTVINFRLAEKSQVILRIYDVLGRELAVPANGIRTAGQHKILIDSSGWPSGLYYARLQTAAFTQTIKLVLIK